jgi:hypothetical protein
MRWIKKQKKWSSGWTGRISGHRTLLFDITIYIYIESLLTIFRFVVSTSRKTEKYRMSEKLGVCNFMPTCKSFLPDMAFATSALVLDWAGSESLRGFTTKNELSILDQRMLWLNFKSESESRKENSLLFSLGQGTIVHKKQSRTQRLILLRQRRRNEETYRDLNALVPNLELDKDLLMNWFASRWSWKPFECQKFDRWEDPGDGRDIAGMTHILYRRVCVVPSGGNSSREMLMETWDILYLGEESNEEICPAKVEINAASMGQIIPVSQRSHVRH